MKRKDANTTVHATGHALVDDYKLDLTIKRNKVGFIQYRYVQGLEVFDDLGLYYPPLITQPSVLNEDLHLDIGKVWVNFGLTLPNWPRLVLRY